MQNQVTLYLTQEETSAIAHALTMVAFNHQKEATFWEGMGDKKLNKRSLQLASLFTKVGNIFAIAHWETEKKLMYLEEEARDNV